MGNVSLANCNIGTAINVADATGGTVIVNPAVNVTLTSEQAAARVVAMLRNPEGFDSSVLEQVAEALAKLDDGTGLGCQGKSDVQNLGFWKKAAEYLKGGWKTAKDGAEGLAAFIEVHQDLLVPAITALTPLLAGC